MALNGEFIDDVTLALLSDADLKIFGGNGNFIIKGGDEDLSFARVDCNGLKEFGITADITLNKSTFHKVINKKVTQDSV